MKVTLHNGRGLAVHNDRSARQGEHVDGTRSAENVYMTFMDKSPRFGDPSDGFRTVEQKFYKRMYQLAVDEINKRYIAKGHREKCTTVEKLYIGARTKPRETILQIGKTGETVDRDTLLRCVGDYIAKLMKWSRAHGNCVHVLDFSIHMDEDTPHVHLRTVMDYDDNGVRRINQTEALKRAGIEPPRPLAEGEKETRHNNRLMTFTAMQRELWQEVCKAQGLDIETEVSEPSAKHKKTEHRDALECECAVLESRKERLEKAISERESMNGKLETIAAENADLRAKYNAAMAVKDKLATVLADGLEQVAQEAQARLDYDAEIRRKEQEARWNDPPITVDTSRLPHDGDREIVDRYDSLKEAADALDSYSIDDWER